MTVQLIECAGSKPSSASKSKITNNNNRNGNSNQRSLLSKQVTSRTPKQKEALQSLRTDRKLQAKKLKNEKFASKSRALANAKATPSVKVKSTSRAEKQQAYIRANQNILPKYSGLNPVNEEQQNGNLSPPTLEKSTKTSLFSKPMGSVDRQAVAGVLVGVGAGYIGATAVDSNTDIARNVGKMIKSKFDDPNENFREPAGVSTEGVAKKTFQDNAGAQSNEGEPIGEPIAKPIGEPIAEPIVEPIVEPIGEPIDQESSAANNTQDESSSEPLIEE